MLFVLNTAHTHELAGSPGRWVHKSESAVSGFSVKHIWLACAHVLPCKVSCASRFVSFIEPYKSQPRAACSPLQVAPLTLELNVVLTSKTILLPVLWPSTAGNRHWAFLEKALRRTVMKQ